MNASIDLKRFVWVVRIVFSLVLCGSLCLYVAQSIHWPVIWDTGIMHYVNFLMDQGLTPYRDIFDNNLPGAYFLEGTAMKIFGGGDLGWRLYEFFLTAVLIGSAVVIALPYDWFAGLFAGAVFTLMHAAEGPQNAVQREQVMTTLIVAGYALLFTAMRRQRPWLMLPFGIALGLASSLKPTAGPLAVVLLVGAGWVLYRRALKPWAYVLWGALGLVLALGLSLVFLLHYGVVGDFLAISKRLTPYYAAIGDVSMKRLLATVYHLEYLRLFFFVPVLPFLLKARGGWENWERVALAVGAAFGLASFFVQRKPFDHHLYAFGAFFLLWAAIELTKAWQTTGWLPALAVAAFGLWLVWIVRREDKTLLVNQWAYVDQARDITSDLRRLGGSSLQHEVQCFDLVAGCDDALYRLRLVPYTTFMGDYMFFPPPEDKPLPGVRGILMADFERKPPKVIVATDLWMTYSRSFRKFDEWPELERFIADHYRLEGSGSYPMSAYRVYVLNAGDGAGR